MEHDNNSICDTEVLQMSVTCLHRKRKLQAEQLDIPPSKHACASRSVGHEYGASTATTQTNGSFRNVAVVYMDGTAKADYSEAESAKGSNSVAADTDSVMSTFCDAETDEAHSKEYASDLPSTSSSNWSSNCSSCGHYSSASKSLIKPGPKRPEYAGYDIDDTDHDFGVHSPLYIEEDVLEIGGHMDGCCSECKAPFQECENKEYEQYLYTNEESTKSSVLASGEWIGNDDTQQNTKKLTIDKEFEQYFSALML